MKLSRLPGKPGQYLPLVLLWLVLWLLLPRTAKFGYDYRKGSPWKHENLIAQFDFPILKTEEQILEEKSKSDGGIVPYYRYAADVANRNIKAAEGLDLGVLKSTVVGEIRSLYERGIVSDAGVKTDKKGDPNAVLFIQKDKRAVQRPVTEVYKESAARAKLVADVGAKFHHINVDSILRAAMVYDLIVPNLVYDKQMTALTHAESSSYISPTSGFVNRGQLIVSEGEIITAEIAQMLDSYKVEYEANMGYTGPRILFWLGNALIALALVLIFYLIIYFANPAIFAEPNRYLYLQLVFLLLTVTALVIGKAAPDFLYMVPFTLGATFLHAFFNIAHPAADFLRGRSGPFRDVPRGGPVRLLQLPVLQPGLAPVPVRRRGLRDPAHHIFRIPVYRCRKRQSLPGSGLPVPGIAPLGGRLSRHLSVREDFQPPVEFPPGRADGHVQPHLA